MIRLETVYILAGLMFASFALFSLQDRSRPNSVTRGLFWGIYALTFLLGGELPNFVMGCMAIALALIAGSGRLGGGGAGSTSRSAESRETSARRFGNALFIPALLIPIVTLIGTLTLKYVPFVEHKNVTLIALVLGTLVAFSVGLLMLKDSALAAVKDARHTMDAVGWTAILPQMLAALGALFALAGVGHVVSHLVGSVLPKDSAFAAVAAYTVGMALFTVIMGNAFAAFPVMTLGIGLPLIGHHFGGNPAILGAIGMLSGFCGTLMTPMAANFNIVPAALLGLKDQHGVIKVQWPTGIMLLIVNTALLYFLVFRF